MMKIDGMKSQTRVEIVQSFDPGGFVLYVVPGLCFIISLLVLFVFTAFTMKLRFLYINHMIKRRVKKCHSVFPIINCYLTLS